MQRGQANTEAVGQSEPFLDFQDQIARVAPVERPVLLIGERGTGKELAAQRLHFLSRRWDGPMVTLNCSSLSANLIESELFGYEKGAFTGANVTRKGRFERASGGTLFLDELGTIPLEVQEKILRVIEYGVFERIGGEKAIEVDVRIVGATNADLRAMARTGEFKPDLLDRLSFDVLTLPPLRYRGEDILILANYFAGRIAFELGKDALPRFSVNAKSCLAAHRWPGNIRELKNVVERAVYKSDADVIDNIVFDPFQSPYAGENENNSITRQAERVEKSEAVVSPAEIEEWNFKRARRNLEVNLVNSALQRSKYNQKEAASLLGLSYDQFRGLIKKYKNSID